MKRILLMTLFACGLTAINLGGPAGCGSGAPAAQCGDGILSGAEVCDGGALNGESCESQGFSPEGSLKCAADCRSFDTSGCVPSGTVSGLVDITGDGDEFANLEPDSLGNLYVNIRSASTTVTAGGKSVTNTLPGGHHRPSAGKVDPDGMLAWLEGFQSNGATDDQGVDPIFDSSGNAYFQGSYYGATLTAPGKTLTNIDPSGNSSDAYVGRFHPDGTIDWIDTFSSGESDQEFLQFSPSGELYVGGFFNGPSLAVGGKTLVNAGNGTSDRFIGKIDPSDGSFLWVTSFASDSFDGAFPAFDESGNLYAIGDFQGTNLAVNGVNKLANASAGSTDAFAAKLDPATGNLMWITGFSSNGSDNLNSGTVTDLGGNFYVHGQFSGASLTAGTKTLANADGSGTTVDPFVAKINPADGTLAWITAASSDKSDYASLTMDPSGNVYMSGSFQGAALALGGKSLTNADASGTTPDGYLARLNPADGTASWLVGFSSDGNDAMAYALADPSGDVYVNSFFSGTAMTTAGRTLTNGDASGTTEDSFLAKFHADGTLVWIVQATGTGDDFLNLDSDPAKTGGALYVDGQFKSATSTISDWTLANADASGKTNDAFVGRLNPADGTFLWMIPVSSDGDDSAILVPDDVGDLFFGGSFKGTTLTILGQTFTNADSSGKTRDAFVGKIAP